MEKIKSYIFRNFEQILVLFILISVFVINYCITLKLALLNLFYLPVLTAGFILGKKKAVITSVFSVLAVTFYVIMFPDQFKSDSSSLSLCLTLISWGSFLTLSAVLVGYLHEENEKKITQLKSAYIGILEILSKYIESADKYTKGHSVRVAQYATETALEMGLPQNEVDNIKVAALLHDVGKVEISTELIQKAANLTSDERYIVESHTEKGAKIISSLGGILNDAVPLVLSHHKYFSHDGHKDSKYEILPLGARILAVADSYDAMVTDRPYRSGMPPWEAVEELRRCSGTQFDPEVVNAFVAILGSTLGTHAMLSGEIEEHMQSSIL